MRACTFYRLSLIAIGITYRWKFTTCHHLSLFIYRQKPRTGTLQFYAVLTFLVCIKPHKLCIWKKIWKIKICILILKQYEFDIQHFRNCSHLNTPLTLQNSITAILLFFEFLHLSKYFFVRHMPIIVGYYNSKHQMFRKIRMWKFAFYNENADQRVDTMRSEANCLKPLSDLKIQSDSIIFFPFLGNNYEIYVDSDLTFWEIGKIRNNILQMFTINMVKRYLAFI